MTGSGPTDARDPRRLVRAWARRALVAAALGTLLRAPDAGLAALVAGAALFAFLPASVLGERGERLGWAVVSFLVVERLHSPIPLGVVVHAGLAVGALYVVVATFVVFFSLARVLAPRGSPGPLAQVAVTLVALLVALEGGLRLKQTGAQDVVMNDVVPLFGSGGNPRLLSPGPSPRLDLRERLFSPRKDPGVFRVALLGGSAAWGHGLASRELSPAGRLEAALGAHVHGKRPEVLCLAYPGLTSEHETGIVLGQALAWEVDLFLALDGYNDMTVAARRAGEAGFPGNMYLWPQHRAGFGKPLLRWLWQRSLLLRPLTSPAVLLPPPDFQNPLTPALENDYWLEALALNEESLAALARDAGARFAWARQPIVSDRSVPAPGDRDAFRPAAYGAEVVRRAREVERVVPARVVARGGIVLDLAARIDARGREKPDERWFADECHWTEAGVGVLAEEIAQGLARAGALP